MTARQISASTGSRLTVPPRVTGGGGCESHCCHTASVILQCRFHPHLQRVESDWSLSFGGDDLRRVSDSGVTLPLVSTRSETLQIHSESPGDSRAEISQEQVHRGRRCSSWVRYWVRTVEMRAVLVLCLLVSPSVILKLVPHELHIV